jgi:carbamoyltransferase
VFILGLSFYYHDSAAALLQDGCLVAGAEEERFSRVKHDHGFPTLAIDFCLKQAGITPSDLDYVVFYEKPFVKFERILLTSLGTFPRSWKLFREAMLTWFGEKLWIRNDLVRRLGVPADRVLFTDHHLAHAASALFCSPFEEAAILTVDGVGEWTTATLGQGRANWDGNGTNEILLSHEQRFPHSLGMLYSAFTAWLGFKVNEGEYKVMGMAPYGSPRYMDRLEKVFRVNDDGSFGVNMDYFSYHVSTEHTYGPRFVDLFGPPRDAGSEFVTRLTHPQASLASAAEMEANQYYADVAASIQRVTEETLLKMANHLYERTGIKRLCMAGGVALNSVANGRILRETPFEQIYIQPAAGDSGGALGAALYAYHILLNQPRRFVLEHAYWGQEYDEPAIRAFLEQKQIPYHYFDDDEMLLDRVVDGLLDGKVVGWYQGRFEWGPRALGNRSILADPRRAEMKDIVNLKIKFREPFRPFAPVLPEDQVSSFFVGDGVKEQYPARFMLLVLPIQADKQDVIPAVNHLGTGRLQTVRAEWNPRYNRVVERFGQATGVPVLMNTSFNLRGEPIVNTPANAFHTFSHSGLDLLVLGQFLVTKTDLGQSEEG